MVDMLCRGGSKLLEYLLSTHCVPNAVLSPHTDEKTEINIFFSPLSDLEQQVLLLSLICR